jgi:hypothetical protein
MGYGHLRAAHALARELGVEVARIDRPPWASDREARWWDRARRLYESISRGAGPRLRGAVARRLLAQLTAIEPFAPGADQSAAPLIVHLIDRLLGRGLGGTLADRLERSGSPVVATYFLPALAADRCRRDGREPPPVFCLVTDTDLARAWAPQDPASCRIQYLATSRRAADRLACYGVRPARIHETGYPLPGELLGGPKLPALRRNLARRLVRLDRGGSFLGTHRHEIEADLGPLPTPPERPPLLTFAVGGAGAQVEIARQLLAGLAPLLHTGALRLALVAGVRGPVAERFRAWVAAAKLPPDAVRVLHERTLDDYFPAVDRLLAETDLLWTKPSEMTFFAALGIPLLLAPPLGKHEEHNRDWALGARAAFVTQDPARAGEWLAPLLADGSLAEAAWDGYRNLPSAGLYRIVELVENAVPEAVPEVSGTSEKL